MRSTIIGTVLALATLFGAAPAMAGEKHDVTLVSGRRGSAEGGTRDAKMSFPMPAAAFKQKIDARQAKAREHMEKRAAKLNAEDAKALRAKFDAGVAKVNAEVSKATADGTVTKEEAQAVRKVARENRPHGGKHARHGKKHERKNEKK